MDKIVKKASRVLGSIEERLNRQDETQTRDTEEHRLSESDRSLLRDFCVKINSLTNKLCPVCYERFPSIELVREMCRHCY